MKSKTLHVLLLIIISGLIGYYIGVSKVSFEWKNFKPEFTVASKEPPASVSHLDLALFWNVLEKLQTSYYDKSALNSQKLLDGAISGMVQSLGDPYTVFLPPTQNNDFKAGMAGQFEGIGAELGMDGKQIIVTAPLDGSPAQKAGIRAGDAILKVGDLPTLGWTLVQAVEKIRGPKNSLVTLNILHKGSEKPEDIKITRGTITMKSVVGKVKGVEDINGIKLGDKIQKDGDSDLTSQKDEPSSDVPLLGSAQNVAYIRLSQFGDNTNKEWLALVNRIDLQIKKNPGKVKGVILDLRNNPGGYLTDATFIAAEFLKEGVVVIQDKGAGDRIEFKVARQGLLLDIPLVVLINKGSASASEIVAGALRDYKRAILIGETSFGKGTIQAAEDLGNGAGLHVTIAKWLTPKEIWVHGKGLKPDIEVALDTKDPTHDTQLERAVKELVK